MSVSVQETVVTNEIEPRYEIIDNSNLIEVTQLPIITERLLSVKEQFEAAANEAKAMDCTEETLKLVKGRRAQLTKIFNLLEEKRKEAKKAILAPYDAFEQIYKSCVTDIYKPCDNELADKIHDVEDSLKQEKRAAALDYFEEACRAANIDFLTLDRVGLNIGLTTSKKAIRDKISVFILKVSEELSLIDTVDNGAEILVEYKQSLNVANAINTVNKRHAAMEAEQQKLEAKRIKNAEQAAAIERVEQAAAEMNTPITETVSEAEAAAPVEIPEEIYELTFTVKGTLSQLKALKAFLVENGYDVRNGGDENE